MKRSEEPGLVSGDKKGRWHVDLSPVITQLVMGWDPGASSSRKEGVKGSGWG